MGAREFSFGQNGAYRFSYDADGGLHAEATDDGHHLVVAGQTDLHEEIAAPQTWTEVDDATGNNARISDGKELYAGAGFGDPLIDGQRDDVLWALRGLAERPNGRLLELGCGPGFLMESMQDALSSWEIVGVDPSPDSVAQATSRGLDCRQGFIDTVDLDGTFDAAVVMGNLQLHPDPQASLAHLAQYVKPGGILFVDSKNPRTFTRLLASRLVSVPRIGSAGAVQAFAAHAFHGLRHCLTKTQLVDALEGSGWTAAEVRTTAPRLLRYDNTHALAQGPKGTLWRGLNGVDALTDQRAWIQIRAVRTGTLEGTS